MGEVTWIPIEERGVLFDRPVVVILTDGARKWMDVRTYRDHNDPLWVKRAENAPCIEERILFWLDGLMPPDAVATK